MQKYIIEVLKRENNAVTYYGMKGIFITFSLDNFESKAEALDDFIEGHGYSSYGMACKNPVWQARADFGVNIRNGSGYHLLKQAEQRANFKRRKEALLDAKNFFSIIEKETAFAVEVPIKCTSLKVTTPKTKIVVKENRTHIADCSFHTQQDLKDSLGRGAHSNYGSISYVSANISDFSHVPESSLFDYSHENILMAMSDFADNWEDIKKQCLAEIQATNPGWGAKGKRDAKDIIDNIRALYPFDTGLHILCKELEDVVGNLKDSSCKYAWLDAEFEDEKESYGFSKEHASVDDCMADAKKYFANGHFPSRSSAHRPMIIVREICRGNVISVSKYSVFIGDSSQI